MNPEDDIAIDMFVSRIMVYAGRRKLIRRSLFNYLRAHGARGHKKAEWISDVELAKMADAVRRKELGLKGGTGDENK